MAVCRYPKVELGSWTRAPSMTRQEHPVCLRKPTAFSIRFSPSLYSYAKYKPYSLNGNTNKKNQNNKSTSGVTSIRPDCLSFVTFHSTIYSNIYIYRFNLSFIFIVSITSPYRVESYRYRVDITPNLITTHHTHISVFDVDCPALFVATVHLSHNARRKHAAKKHSTR